VQPQRCAVISVALHTCIHTKTHNQRQINEMVCGRVGVIGFTPAMRAAALEPAAVVAAEATLATARRVAAFFCSDSARARSIASARFKASSYDVCMYAPHQSNTQHATHSTHTSIAALSTLKPSLAERAHTFCCSSESCASILVRFSFFSTPLVRVFMNSSKESSPALPLAAAAEEAEEEEEPAAEPRDVTNPPLTSAAPPASDALLISDNCDCICLIDRSVSPVVIKKHRG
jgi:hypothetical protein